MSRLPKFTGSKIPPPSSTLPKSGAKDAEFKMPQTKLNSAKSTTKLNKVPAIVQANVPQLAAALKSSMSQSKQGATDLKRSKAAPSRGVVAKYTVRPTATVSAVLAPNTNLNRRPMKRAGAAINNVNPKITKQTPPKPKVKPVPKPAPYDYKARFGLLKENHDNLKSNHSNLKERFNEISDVNEVLTTSNEQLKTDMEAANSELEHLRAEALKVNTENGELRTYLRLAENELDETRVKLADLERIHNHCDINFKEITVKYNDTKSRLDMTSTYLDINKELVATLKDQVYSLDMEKRQLHNEIQDMKGNIRVFCRVRPSLQEERNKLQCIINLIDENSVELSKGKESLEPTGRPRTSKSEFSFDRVFMPNASQEDVFVELAQLVQSVLDGYNVCVFAYGQTGSGKTYTMEGGFGEHKMGMIPRAIDLIFASFAPMERLGWCYQVKASFLEIYNDNIVDLLNPDKGHHEIRMTDAKGTDVYVTNLTVELISSADELKKFMNIAQQNRAVAATENNERSSRSHSVSKILLEAVNEERNEKITASLNLVDLAGSERMAMTSSNSRVAETKNINRSLSDLGNVILALVQKESHVPYRNSKLTRLLMPCLGGNSKTLMLVNIAPFEECYSESINSLRFASSVNQCKTGTVKKNKTLQNSSSFV